MILLLAIPVVHSSGAWIASTAASGYIASTLSATWIGSFMLGNSGVLSMIGLASAGGILATVGVVSSAVRCFLSKPLIAVGLESWAQAICPERATFLGMTSRGWLITGAVLVPALVLVRCYFRLRTSMNKINEERVAGGLDEITAVGVLGEIFRETKKKIRGKFQEIMKKIRRK